MPSSQSKVISAFAIVVALCLPGTSALAAPGDPVKRGKSAHGKKCETKKNCRGKRKHSPRKAYWGAWIGSQLTGDEAPWDMSAVTAFERMAGKGLSLLHFSSPFANCHQGRCVYAPFPRYEMETIRAYGALPFFSWATASNPIADDLSDPQFRLSEVLSGRHDAYIRSFAEGAREWGHPFFLRFNWEMNGKWFSWAEGVNGNQPGEYVAVWRHVREIFRSVGANNATWVWCPYADGPGRLAPLGQFYPGDEYVDWTCLDGFNWAGNSVNPHPWRSFDKIFARSYRTVTKKIAPTKPMIVAEIASNGGPRAKSKWIRDMLRELVTDYRRIRGLLWFNKIDRNLPWPIESSAAATRAFADGIRRNRFLGSHFANATTSPIPPPK